jgi:hypothetical protein
MAPQAIGIAQGKMASPVRGRRVRGLSEDEALIDGGAVA